MEAKIKYKSTGYRELMAMIAKSSGYHLYEVEDIMNHFIGNAQVLLSEGKTVKLSGLGVLKVSELTTTDNYRDEKECYNSFRLSMSLDDPMRRYLKENYSAKSTNSN